MSILETERGIKYMNANLILEYNKKQKTWSVVRNRSGYRFKTQQNYKDFLEFNTSGYVYDDGPNYKTLLF